MDDNIAELNSEEVLDVPISNESEPNEDNESTLENIQNEGLDNSDNDKKSKKKKTGKAKVRNYWPLKITIITFCLSLFFSFVSELATSGTGIAVAVILLVLLIITSIIFDGIGVSVTSCNLAPLNSMAARKVPYARVAILLVKNASKVNNICADVIGDICGIVSGACGASLVASIMMIAKSANEFVVAILVSAFIAALTVGGKAFEKTIAIKKSQQLVMMTARVIGIFYNPDRKRKKNARKDK